MNNITYRFKFLLNFFGVTRFFLIKILYWKGLYTNRVFVVERGGLIRTRNKGKIRINGKARLFAYSELTSRGVLEIGNNFYLNKYSRIIALDTIKIGNNVTIAQFVSILDHDHNFFLKENKLILDKYKTAPISIGDNVWIADKVMILKGVSIGNNVVIAANTLVNKDVPDNCIVGGTPFKIIRKLNG